MQTMISAQNGHPNVVRALLEFRGRELLMLTMGYGESCLSIARWKNHGEVCSVLEMACRNAGLSSREITILVVTQGSDGLSGSDKDPAGSKYAGNR